MTGFGYQVVNALHPTEPQPGSRLYYAPDLPQFQFLKQWRCRKFESAFLRESEVLLRVSDTRPNTRWALLCAHPKQVSDKP